MQLPNNPAGRLLHLVEKGREIADGTQTMEAWSRLFALPRENLPELLEMVSAFYSLPEEIERRIRVIDDINADLYLKWRAKARPAFTHLNLASDWKSAFKSRFDNETVYGIEICNDLLARRAPEKKVSSEDLDNLAGKVNELLGLLEEAEIDFLTKEYIRSRLEGIRKALNGVAVLGAKSLEREFQVVVGSLTINNRYNLQSDGSEIKNKFWQVVICLSALISLMTGAIQLEEKVIKALPAHYQTPVRELVVNKIP